MVERGVLGFPKHNLAVSLWTPCFGKSKSNTIENTAEVRPVAGGAKPPRNVAATISENRAVAN